MGTTFIERKIETENSHVQHIKKRLNKSIGLSSFQKLKSCPLTTKESREGRPGDSLVKSHLCAFIVHIGMDINTSMCNLIRFPYCCWFHIPLQLNGPNATSGWNNNEKPNTLVGIRVD